MTKNHPILQAILAITLSTSCTQPTITVCDLTCEHLTDPLGIDTKTPRLSWKINNNKQIRGQQQTAYRILVATTKNNLKKNNPDIWDSGTIHSDRSHLITYAGPPLKSGSTCYWKVQAYDRDGHPSTWSHPAKFSIGLDSTDWQGQWIKHPTATPEKHIWYRKTTTINNKPETAYAYIASQGNHELYINGRPADNRILAPAVSRNDRRVLYVTYDITPLLQKGRNTIAIWYGPGWTRNNYFQPLTNQAILAQINITTPNHNPTTITTDTTWLTAESHSSNTGGYSFMNMGGEQIDGRQYNQNWNHPNFNDSNWTNAAPANPLKQPGTITLSPQMTDPTTIIKTIPAKTITDTVPGVYRVDMGEHFTGYIQAKFHGLTSGDTIQITISEKTYATHNGQDMHPSGRIGNHTIEDHRQRHTYIARGQDGETFRNRFNYFSGRYIHLKGLPAAPSPEDITGYAISSAPPRTAKFQSSDTLYNKIFEADLNTFEMCNTEGVTVDCPNRERLGYGPEGAYQTTWGLGLPCFETGAYYIKNTRDWADVQRPDGFINNVAPQISIMYGCVLNGTAPMNIALEHFQKYGDTTILKTVQPVGKQWLQYLQTHVKNNMLTRYATHGYFLGDWVSPGPTFEYAETEQALYFNNCIYAITLQHYIDICTHLNIPENQITPYRTQLQALRRAIHEKYYNPDTHTYLNGDQARTTCALYARIVPDTLRHAVIQHLENDLRQEHPYINIGSFARYPYYKTIITENNLYQPFAQILTKTTYPGYGHFIASGCNLFPETWEIAHSNCAQTHTSYLGITAYLIKGLAGIEYDTPNRQANITPHTIPHLDNLSAQTQTPYGTIHSNWNKTNNTTHYQITIPIGLKAKITIPAPQHHITENGKPLHNAKGIINTTQTNQQTTITAESGTYNLTTTQ
jgi:alpha-L-rhamnosidase